MVALELDNCLQFPQGLCLDRLRLVFIIEDGFEFLLLAQYPAHGRRVIQPQAALLEAGMALQYRRLARGRVGNFGHAELFAVYTGEFRRQIQRVDGG